MPTMPASWPSRRRPGWRRLDGDPARVSRHLAEDAAQDTYLRAIRALPAYRGEAAARAWSLSIARRAAVDAVRAAVRRRRLDRLVAARTGFVLTQLLAFDYAGAAAVCGCPIGTIRSRVARACDELIRELELPDLT